MRRRVWVIRLIFSVVFILLSLIISFFLSDAFAVNFLNTSFVIGLLLLAISGASFVIINGFFDVFALGWKRIFSREDLTDDRSHWSYDRENTSDSEKDVLRKKAKNELFIFLPMTIGIVLVVLSLVILQFI